MVELSLLTKLSLNKDLLEMMVIVTVKEVAIVTEIMGVVEAPMVVSVLNVGSLVISPGSALVKEEEEEGSMVAGKVDMVAGVVVVVVTMVLIGMRIVILVGVTGTLVAMEILEAIGTLVIVLDLMNVEAQEAFVLDNV